MRQSKPLRMIPTSAGYDPNDLAKIIESLQKGSVACITGAGCSTESGIPDYRSPEGSYSKGYKPMTHQDFMNSEFQRKRYWARSTMSWPGFKAKQQNACHESVDAMLENKALSCLITQNVDSLHKHPDTVHLHGRLNSVRCMECKSVHDRDAFQDQMLELNPVMLEMNVGGDRFERSDGDVEFENKDVFTNFNIPPCGTCGSRVMKPNVVLFGDSVPLPTVDHCMERVSHSSAVLCLGTSLMVYSSWRFVKLASKLDLPIYVVNIGPTRADNILDVKLETRVSEVLPIILHSI
eukprot:TRINITY_DN12859_c4_g1_i1.p1 TRINITY_DN12859_c4_g1~~TRINITY_DN12859_c4_g1_i1.p1  ORF type:complete len:293 (+),score=37.57 TRINITY_DN12859_c4_g1_i1:49-927(+)